MFKKLAICVIALLVFALPAFAGGVQSDNSGNAGYLFVATGENHGKDSRGIWTDPSELGLKGEKGDTGEAGPQGTTGEQGSAGQDGAIGPEGVAGEEGKAGDKGSQGDTGEKGQQGIEGPQGQGLQDRVELIGEVRVLDTKRTTWSIYAGRDVNNGVGIYGAKVTVKLGRSYEERRLDELEAKLNMMQPTVQEDVIVVPTATGFKIQVTK